MSAAFFGFLLAVCMALAVRASVFRSSYREISALVGNDVTMECSVSIYGQSEPVIWQNGSIVLSMGRRVYQPPESNRISIEGDSGDAFNLRIRIVTVYDAGNYSCQVPGRGTEYIQLVVNVPASIKFYPDGDTVTAVEESELSLICRGFGNPEPLIQWIFHGEEESLEIVEQGGKENMMITEIHRSDAGAYECRASNGVGVPASRTIQVEVEYAPFVLEQAPVVYVAPGQDAAIECFFSANPDVEDVRWYHNASHFNTESRRNMKENRRKIEDYDVWELHIRDLQPDQLGTYFCYGENKIGTVYGTIKLSPFPYDLKIISIHKHKYSDQYTLRWTVSSPMKLLNFMIALKQLNDSFNTDWHNFSIPVSGPYWKRNHTQEYTFQQLAANADYTILVKARNLYGYSDWSEGLTFHTSESRGAFTEPKTLFHLLLAFLLLKNLDAIC